MQLHCLGIDSRWLIT